MKIIRGCYEFLYNYIKIFSKKKYKIFFDFFVCTEK